MIIDIDKLPKDGLKVSRNFDFPSIDLIEEDAVFLQRVHGELTIKRIGEEVMVMGRITTCLSLVCSRCLAPFEFAVDSRFDLVFLPEDVHEMKDELEDEDLDKIFYKSHHIDLREVILEQLNLTFPSKPLCSERCEGICAVCGQVRHGGNCGCLVKEPEGRLGKLKYFMKDKS